MQLLAWPAVRSAQLCCDAEAPLTHRILASPRWTDAECAARLGGKGRTRVGELGKDSGELVEGGHSDETGAEHRVRGREGKRGRHGSNFRVIHLRNSRLGLLLSADTLV